MMLQILPPDFQYATETTVINKAELLSFVVLTALFGLFLFIKFVKTDKFSLVKDLKFIANFLFATIKKDLKIN